MDSEGVFCFISISRVRSCCSDRSGSQLMISLALYFVSNRERAAQAESFKIAGPLNPQCVIRRGPTSWSLLPTILTTVFSTLMPISLVIELPGMLNVNKEGTGSSIECPDLMSHSNIDDFGNPPQATHTKSETTRLESESEI